MVCGWKSACTLAGRNSQNSAVALTWVGRELVSMRLATFTVSPTRHLGV